jgi:hypothetical protein
MLAAPISNLLSLYSMYSHYCIELIKVKVRVTLLLAVYRQSLCIGVKTLETHDQRFFSPTEPLR